MRWNARKRAQHTTPVGISADSTGAIEVVDPAHPLYGLTLPLINITTHPRLGRICIVSPHSGGGRVIPIAATDRGGVLPTPARGRLSLTAIRRLVAVLACLQDTAPE